MIDFPASPAVGAIFTSGNQQWTWDGVKWLPSGLGAAQIVPAMNDNRIINGDMRIDQRNNGASGTAIGYTIDRWQYSASQASKGTWQRITASVGASIYSQGFPYYLNFASSSAYVLTASDYFQLSQLIEADMVSDFAWGTPQAQPVTLSFWAQSSLTGTFSGAVISKASTRAYPFTFSLPTANTFTKIVVTIPGDTSGTWVLNGNAGSVYVIFDLGTGATYRGPAGAWASAPYNAVTGAVSIIATNGATFGVTGVKLEIGSIATPFNRQSLAKSLADCQRYFEMSYDLGTAIGTATSIGAFLTYQTGLAAGTNTGSWTVGFKATKRVAPTVTYYSGGTGTAGKIWDGSNTGDVTPSVNANTTQGITGYAAMKATQTNVNLQGQWTASAEL